MFQQQTNRRVAVLASGWRRRWRCHRGDKDAWNKIAWPEDSGAPPGRCNIHPTHVEAKLRWSSQSAPPAY